MKLNESRRINRIVFIGILRRNKRFVLLYLLTNLKITDLRDGFKIILKLAHVTVAPDVNKIDVLGKD